MAFVKGGGTQVYGHLVSAMAVSESQKPRVLLGFDGAVYLVAVKVSL